MGILLQMSAANIDLRAVILGWLATRAWSLSVTSHHLNVDWELWQRARRLRLYRHGHASTLGPSMFAPGGVVNDIYGFLPHAPRGWFLSIKYLESGATLCMGAVACLAPTTRASVYFTLGGGHIATVDTLCIIAPVLTAVGFGSIIGGAIMAYGSRI